MAVSAVIARRPLRISVKSIGGYPQGQRHGVGAQPTSSKTLRRCSPRIQQGGNFLVIVRDFDFMSISLPPAKTDPVLVIDADAVLPGAIARKLLQPQTRKRKIHQRCRRIQKTQFDTRAAFSIF